LAKYIAWGCLLFADPFPQIQALTNEIKEVLIDRAMSMKISVDDVSITTLSVLCEEENYYKAEQDSSSAIIRAQVLLKF
jgi:uncharacterized protein Smg (DUF494 family)